MGTHCVIPSYNYLAKEVLGSPFCKLRKRGLESRTSAGTEQSLAQIWGCVVPRGPGPLYPAGASRAQELPEGEGGSVIPGITAGCALRWGSPEEVEPAPSLPPALPDFQEAKRGKADLDRYHLSIWEPGGET